ncbi:hypothetical protein ABZ897_11980 [Nonomuraea sp. NPDC046802]|uniref:hypothetical protein n=1 Tax=Nonomuraea sp. NPDC046802 TaxID=3154919 RepID=UPI0033F96920
MKGTLIVGVGLRSVVARMTFLRAAGWGALSGAFFGLLIGLFFGIFACDGRRRTVVTEENRLRLFVH